MEIIPAILTKSYEDMKNKISMVRGFVPIVQIDVCDGKYTPSSTWPFLGFNNFDKYFLAILDEREGMPFWEEIDFEIDLMVTDAIDNFDIYTKLSPRRIVFHLEAMRNKEDFFEFLEGIDPYFKDSIEFGVAVLPSTDISILSKCISHISFVQFMGIEKIGHQGEDFDEKVFTNIKKFKKEYPDIIVSVDGGVTLAVAEELKNIGVDRVVSGSAIYSSDDIIGKIEEFRNI